MRKISNGVTGRVLSVVTVMVGGLALGAGAAAQQQPSSQSPPAASSTTQPQGSGGTAREKKEVSARDESILRRPRAERPDGLPVGQFILFPRIEIEGEYDDNVFRTRNSTKDDLIGRVRPGFSLVSDWERHSLEIYGQAELARYATYSSLNYESFQAGGRGRIDFTDELAWHTEIDFARIRVPPGAPGLFGAVGTSQTMHVLTTGGYLAYSGDPFFFRIGPRVRRIDYVKGVVGDQDFTTYEVAARAGYRVTPDVSVFLDTSYQWVRYSTKIDTAGFNQNNDGFDVRLGVAYDITRVVSAELGVGYFRRDFDDSRYKPQDGVSVQGKIYWNPSDTFSIEAEARRSLSEYRSALANAATSNAVQTFVGLRMGWEPIEPLMIDGGVSWDQYNYRGQGQKEDYYTFDIGAKYYFSPQVWAGPRYIFQHRHAKPSALNYVDNRFLLTLGGAL
ncbi:MAG: outer membrane beta-barrel protein [Rhodospirillales bacterium]|nr:MAG: outer membrane beta-barrel protein [Rhodospirillales bacterium]